MSEEKITKLEKENKVLFQLLKEQNDRYTELEKKLSELKKKLALLDDYVYVRMG
jgi:predicted nuclease with TOPRIM domain